MSPWVYVIVPGYDPFWMRDVRGAVSYLPPSDPIAVFAPSRQERWPAEPGTATVRRFRGCGWRVTINIAAAAAFGLDPFGEPQIPRGTVMPGWVWGVQGDFCFTDEYLRPVYEALKMANGD